MSDAHLSALLLADSAIVPMLDRFALTSSIRFSISDMSNTYSSKFRRFSRISGVKLSSIREAIKASVPFDIIYHSPVGEA